jgi:hypothetical protein
MALGVGFGEVQMKFVVGQTERPHVAFTQPQRPTLVAKEHDSTAVGLSKQPARELLAKFSFVKDFRPWSSYGSTPVSMLFGSAISPIAEEDKTQEGRGPEMPHLEQVSVASLDQLPEGGKLDINEVPSK